MTEWGFHFRFKAKTFAVAAAAAATVLGTTAPASAAPAERLHDVNCISASDGFLHFGQNTRDRCFAYAGDLGLPEPGTTNYFPINAYDSGNNAGYFQYKVGPNGGIQTERFPKWHYHYFNPSVNVVFLHVD